MKVVSVLAREEFGMPGEVELSDCVMGSRRGKQSDGIAGDWRCVGNTSCGRPTASGIYIGVGHTNATHGAKAVSNKSSALRRLKTGGWFNLRTEWTSPIPTPTGLPVPKKKKKKKKFRKDGIGSRWLDSRVVRVRQATRPSHVRFRGTAAAATRSGPVRAGRLK